MSSHDAIRKIVHEALVVCGADQEKLTDYLVVHLVSYKYNLKPMQSRDFTSSLIAYISKQTGVTFEQVQSKSRKREFVEARQIAMFVLKNFTNQSLKSIGWQFGGRDHSTVIHAKTTISDLMDTDRGFRAKIEKILVFAREIQTTNENKPNIQQPDDFQLGHA